MLLLLYTVVLTAILSKQTAAWDSCLLSTPLKRDDSQTRVLTAITIQSQLERRQVNFEPKRTFEHHYVDHLSLIRGDSARFAKTSMHFKLAALALEDIENHLENIECSGPVIALEFAHEQSLWQARRMWDGLSKFMIISSHPGCNKDGERSPYVVSGITYSSDGVTAVFSVRRIEWNESYDYMKVDFGMTNEGSVGQYSLSGIRSHDSLRLRLGRRQPDDSSTVTYPPAPTSTPSSESSVQNLNFSSFNPSIISLDAVAIGCKNCSIVGTLDITHGTFLVNSSKASNLLENILDSPGSDVLEEAYQFIEHGFFNVVANGMNAHMELETSVSLTVSFQEAIFSLALPGFQIPGIAAVGPQFQALMLGDISITDVVDFTYGFDLTVPDGSSINFDIANVTNSSSQGFSHSNITAIPFAASSESIALTLSLTLRAEVLLGVDILSGDGFLHAGMFLDLPALSTSISKLSNVNAQCEPLNSSSPTTGLLSHVFPGLTNIIPSAAIGIGFEAGAALEVPPVLETLVPSVSIEAEVTLAGISMELETVCLSWDSGARAFVSPTFATPTTTTTTTPTSATGIIGTGSGASGQKNFGDRLLDRNPIARNQGIGWATTAFLGCIIGLAAL